MIGFVHNINVTKHTLKYRTNNIYYKYRILYNTILVIIVVYDLGYVCIFEMIGT